MEVAVRVRDFYICLNWKVTATPGCGTSNKYRVHIKCRQAKYAL